MKKGKKITILGAGRVGATIAYTLTLDSTAAEIALIDIAEDKAAGEAKDIFQGTSFTAPINIYSGDYSAAKRSDIVIITVGAARKPEQSRNDLAQGNVNILKEVMPKITQYAPDAVYIVVSNPIDILTHYMIKKSGLDEGQIIGTGTLLDTARLRASLSEVAELNSKNVHAYVFGEHGDTSVFPWSLANIGGIPIGVYCESVGIKRNLFSKNALNKIEGDVRSSGATVISLKGATYYAISVCVRRICETIIRDTNSILTVSHILQGQYGITDVCMSLPFIINAHGVVRKMTPPLTESEINALSLSAQSLKDVIKTIEF